MRNLKESPAVEVAGPCYVYLEVSHPEFYEACEASPRFASMNLLVIIMTIKVWVIYRESTALVEAQCSVNINRSSKSSA